MIKKDHDLKKYPVLRSKSTLNPIATLRKHIYRLITHEYIRSGYKVDHVLMRVKFPK